MRLHSAPRVAALSALTLVLAVRGVGAQHDHHATSQPLDAVHLPISCKPSVSAMFDRAVTLLHSFWFKAAIDALNLVAHSDVDCAMAWWGIALAQWGDPLEIERPEGAFEAGRRAIANAVAARSASVRERRYIAAVEELYRDLEAVNQSTRQGAYEQAMARLSEDFPDDQEAAVFAALALLAQTDNVSERQKAGGRLESLRRRYPDHPGLLHYLIHAYDSPTLAANGLKAAEQYIRIAPSSPYALHIASHVFTRLGQWDQSIERNLASADAARRDGAHHDELHALDYQVYGLLQTGRDHAAATIVQRLAGLGTQIGIGHADTASRESAFFALAAMPARFALERGDWEGAAALEVRQTAFPWLNAVTYFARGIGAARGGNIASARQDLARLADIRDALKVDAPNKWSRYVEIRRRILEAYVLFEETRLTSALRLLATVAADEEATGSLRIEPGSLAPARELLGETLLEMNRPAAALVQFERLLAREPNRLRALHGAARAAERSGRVARAQNYYRAIVENCRYADTPARPLIDAAHHRINSTHPRVSHRVSRPTNTGEPVR